MNLPDLARPDLPDFLWTIPFAAVIAVVTFIIFRPRPRGPRSRRPATVPLRSRLPDCSSPASASPSTQTTDHGVNEALFSGQDAIGPLVANPGAWSLSALALLIAFKGLAYGVSLGTFRGGPTFPAMFLGAAGGLMAAQLPGFELTPRWPLAWALRSPP